jgi:hypothetical protein
MRLPLATRKTSEKLSAPSKEQWDALVKAIREVDFKVGPTREQLKTLEREIELVDFLPGWLVKREKVVTSDGYNLDLWTVEKENTSNNYYQTLVKAPLQLAIAWMVNRDVIDDINVYFTTKINDKIVIDLDW